MKVLFLSMFGVLVAMSVASSNADNPLLNELTKLRTATEEQTRFLNSLLGLGGGNEGGADSQSPKVTPSKGLQTSSLRPASLQPASGLQSGASGGIPEDEWRRIFPKKLGTERR